MTVDSKYFKDPALIIEQAEREPCRDCIHRLWLWGKVMPVCRKHEARVGSDVFKCDDYHHGKGSNGT